jgi:hypothetical protein
MSLDDHDPGLAGLEAALAALAPKPGRIDRDVLLFRAGQVSVRRHGWTWPCGTAVLGLIALSLGSMLAFRPASAPEVRVVYITVKEPATPSPHEPPGAPPGPLVVAQEEPFTPPGTRLSPMSYLDLERQVVRWGLDGVPSTPEGGSASGPPLPRERVFRDSDSTAAFTSFFNFRSLFQ